MWIVINIILLVFGFLCIAYARDMKMKYNTYDEAPRLTALIFFCISSLSEIARWIYNGEPSL